MVELLELRMDDQMGRKMVHWLDWRMVDQMGKKMVNWTAFLRV